LEGFLGDEIAHVFHVNFSATYALLTIFSGHWLETRRFLPLLVHDVMRNIRTPTFSVDMMLAAHELHGFFPYRLNLLTDVAMKCLSEPRSCADQGVK